MGYRGPNSARISRQSRANQFAYAGQTAIWRQYVSASAGRSFMGIGAGSGYRQQVITALFAAAYSGQPEMQTPAGLIANADFMVTTQVQMKRTDELIWRGVTYRVESDPTPSRMDSTWMSLVKRATE